MTHNNISRVSFLRHAHSDPAGGDQDRVLSHKGLTQSFNLKKVILFDYDLIICSTAKRTIETAEIIMMAAEKPVPLVISEALYLPKSADDINNISKMLTAYPYATPREMLAKDSLNSWQNYTDGAYDEVMSISTHHNASKLLIISHSTITNLLGMKFIDRVDELMDLYLSPAQGYSVICNR